MTNETVVLIEKLAAQLGETSETLIGWFAMRAYWEWLDVLLARRFRHNSSLYYGSSYACNGESTFAGKE